MLREIDARLEAGEIFGLVGPNGSGKTTLLKAAAGLIAYGGSIRLEGREVAELSPRERARSLAYVPQHSALDAAIAVRDVVLQGRAPHRGVLGVPSREDRRAVDQAVRETALEGLLDRRFDQLSFGERRRVLIARALATESRALLLDEPTAALDVRHVLELFAILRRMAQRGTAILIVLHQLQELVSLADRAALLSEGRIICQGDVSDVVADEPVRRVYGVELRRGAALDYALPAHRSPERETGAHGDRGAERARPQAAASGRRG